MAANIKNSNQSVGKALQIIEVLLESSSPMRLQEIAAAVEMPASTVLRMLSSLMLYNYVDQDIDSKKYFLTLKFAQIGAAVSSRIGLTTIARPILLDLSFRCGEAASIAIEDKMSMVYIDVADGPDGLLKVMQYIGKRSPMHCTGVGKCFLLNYTDAQIDEFIHITGLKRFTPYTLTSKAELLAELDMARVRDFAMDNQECELGARCVAAPIRDYSGKVVAAISVSGPVNRMTPEKVAKVASQVKDAAEQISKKLLYARA